MFYNLLPEFGSLPWTLKPGIMFLAECLLGPSGLRGLSALSALLTGFVWLRLASIGGLELSGIGFLVCTGLASLGSAVNDGLVDGRVSEESTNGESAAARRYICECGTFIGSIVVGICAWLFNLGPEPMLVLTAVAWVSVAFCVLVLDRSSAPKTTSDLSTGDEKAAREAEDHNGTISSLRSLVNGAVGFVSILAFTSCLSPKLDFYMFRQRMLGLSASQQALVSMAGSLGWWLGASTYKHRIAVGRPVHAALKICLFWWPAAAFLQVVVAALASVPPVSTTPALFLPLLAIEKLATEFCTTLTYMPCTVLMQLHSPRGCEATAFSLMQWSGTIGQVLGRNLEYLLSRVIGVSPITGYAKFWQVALATANWRLVTSVALRICVLGRLARAERGLRESE